MAPDISKLGIPKSRLVIKQHPQRPTPVKSGVRVALKLTCQPKFGAWQGAYSDSALYSVIRKANYSQLQVLSPELNKLGCCKQAWVEENLFFRII